MMADKTRIAVKAKPSKGSSQEDDEMQAKFRENQFQFG
jgi:hypothetical protein